MAPDLLWLSDEDSDLLPESDWELLMRRDVDMELLPVIDADCKDDAEYDLDCEVLADLLSGAEAELLWLALLVAGELSVVESLRLADEDCVVDREAVRTK